MRLRSTQRDGRLLRLACALLFLGGLGACAGTTPEADAPEPASAADASGPADDENASESADASEGAPQQEAGAPPADEGDASGTVDVQTFQNALQAVIGDSALLTAMGLDPSSSRPILISGEDLPDGLERAALVRSIEVVPVSDKPGKRTILHFTSIELSPKQGTFKYRCEATGAYGTTRVVYDGEAWQLKSSRVTKP